MDRKVDPTMINFIINFGFTCRSSTNQTNSASRIIYWLGGDVGAKLRSHQPTNMKYQRRKYSWVVKVEPNFLDVMFFKNDSGCLFLSYSSAQ